MKEERVRILDVAVDIASTKDASESTILHLKEEGKEGSIFC